MTADQLKVRAGFLFHLEPQDCMVSTQIPAEGSVRLPVFNDLEAIISVTELRLYQVRRCHGIDQGRVSVQFGIPSFTEVFTVFKMYCSNFSLNFTAFFLGYFFYKLITFF